MRTGDATRLLRPLPPEGNEGNHPPFEGDEGDTFRHRRLWRTWETEEWRTDFPPPPGFDGHEKGEWEGEGYSRALSDAELAALVAAGIAEPPPVEGLISIEQDEAERDAFFAGLAAPAGDAPLA